MTVTPYGQLEWWFLTLLRNGITDPISRGENTTNTATWTTGLPLVYTLSKTRVQCIKSVTVGGVAKKWGYDYTYALEEGGAASTVTLLASPTTGNSVVIVFHNGMSSEEKTKDGQTIVKGGLVDKGFFRSDNTRPKIMVMLDHRTLERKGIGPNLEKWQKTKFIVEVYSEKSNEVKSLAHDVEKLVQASEIPPIGPQFGIVEMVVDAVEPYDYIPDLSSYMIMVTVGITSNEVFA